VSRGSESLKVASAMATFSIANSTPEFTESLNWVLKANSDRRMNRLLMCLLKYYRALTGMMPAKYMNVFRD
jgi:hypothetical protein